MATWKKAEKEARERYGVEGKMVKRGADGLPSLLWMKTAELYCKKVPGSDVCQELAAIDPSYRESCRSNHKHKHKKSTCHKESEYVIEMPAPVKSCNRPRLNQAAVAVDGTPFKAQAESFEDVAGVFNVLMNAVPVGAEEFFHRDTGRNPSAYSWEFPKFMSKDNATALKNLNLTHNLRESILKKFKAILDAKTTGNIAATKDAIEYFSKVKIEAALDADSVSAVACLLTDGDKKTCTTFGLSGYSQMIPLPVSVKHSLSYVENINITHANEIVGGRRHWIGHDNVYREVLAGLLLSELVANKLTPHVSMVYGAGKIIAASTDLGNVFTSATKDAENEEGVTEADLVDVDDKASVVLSPAGVTGAVSTEKQVPGVLVVTEACQSSLAESLSAFCPKMVRVVLLQVCQALISARQHFGFFHNNLTIGNVLLAAVPDDSIFYYKLNGNVRAVASYGVSCRISGFRHCTSSVFDPMDTAMLIASDSTPFRNPCVLSTEMSDMGTLAMSMHGAVTNPEVKTFLVAVIAWMKRDAEMYASAAGNTPNPTDTSGMHRLFQYLASRDSPVITSIPSKSENEVYEAEGAIVDRIVSNPDTYFGSYLTFDSTKKEFYINKNHPVGRNYQRRIERDKPDRKKRQCAAIPECAKRTKAIEAARMYTLEKALAQKDDIEALISAHGYTKQTSAQRRAAAVLAASTGRCATGTCFM